MTGVTETSGQASLPTANSTKSFWHSQPSKTLIGHRTTTTLPAKADIVIIGSGVSGASAAHYLREEENGKDLDIVMLEAREACWGATGRASPSQASLQTQYLTNHRMEVIANLYYMRHPLKLELLNCVITRPSKLWWPNTISLATGDQYREFTHT